MDSPNSIIVAPSILAGNHAHLAESLAIAAEFGAQWIHLDIMDGHFVPNLTFGPETVRALRAEPSGLFFDVHLMLDNPHQYIDAFAKAGADQITIHVEPDYPILETLERIRALDIRCGIVLNPDTPAEAALPFLKHIDIVLLMTVQPGFGGQSFRHDILPKMRQIAEWRSRDNLSFRLEVDGGVDLETAPLCLDNGVDTLVAGTAFYKAADRAAFIQTIEGDQANA